MRPLLLMLLLLSGCVTLDPQTQHRVSIRAQAASRLEFCLGWNMCQRNTPAQRNACVVDSKEFCTNNGLEAACGMDELWTRDYSHCSQR